MITLASDFGSPYPAAMRGVMLQRTDARLVDVTHELPRQDVRAGAFWLRELLPWFPPAVHLAVIDPGVGTDRAALAVRAGDHVLVGPDNGVLVPVARVLGDGEFDCFRIDDEGARSSTFHGRDVFAPAAADVHEADFDPAAVDRMTPVDDYEDFQLPEATVDEAAGRVLGEVLVVDDFGNAITNVPGHLVADRNSVRVDAGTATNDRVPVGKTFDAVDPGQRVITVGSHGNVELDVNRGRGDEAFGVAPGYEVVLKW